MPGDGHPDCKHWPEVYRRISEAGKLVQLYGSFEELDAVASQVGSAKGIHLKDAVANDRESAIARLATYGIE